MKRFNQICNFIFGFALACSLFVVVWAFNYADVERGYNSTGSEVFTIALPFLIVTLKMWTVEQTKNRKRKKNL